MQSKNQLTPSWLGQLDSKIDLAINKPFPGILLQCLNYQTPPPKKSLSIGGLENKNIRISYTPNNFIPSK
jgi:hypothetical protein